MATSEALGRRGLGPWRILVWGVPSLLLLLPAVAMRFTAEVNWTASDFVIMGFLLYGAAGLFELAARATGSAAYRAGAGLAIITAFLLIWINLAVGIIGSEDNPANLVYAGVLTALCGGAAVARFRADGMARTLFVTALLQTAIGFGVLLIGLNFAEPPGPVGLLILNLFFAGLWLMAAALFRLAAGAART